MKAALVINSLAAERCSAMWRPVLDKVHHFRAARADMDSDEEVLLELTAN